MNRLGGRAREWDDRWLPRAASVAQRLVQQARARLDRLVGDETTIGDAVRSEPALAGSLGAVAAAALILAIAGGPGGPPDDDGSAPAPAAFSPLPTTATVGPAPGTTVASYLARARADLQRATAGTAGPTYAVVDLDAYLPTADAARLLAGYEVVRAYVRVPSTLPTQVHVVPLRGTMSGIETGMAASARLAAATAHTFDVLVHQLHPRNGNEQKLRQRYALQQRASSYEATRLQSPRTCQCLFAFVVHADGAALTRLATRPQVRIVDPAGSDTGLDQLTVFPLEPEVSGLVPRGGLFGG